MDIVLCFQRNSNTHKNANTVKLTRSMWCVLDFGKGKQKKLNRTEKKNQCRQIEENWIL